MSDEHVKHLEFVQNVITRMNANSFAIKSWTVAIVSALLAIYASTGNHYFILTGTFPVIVFWLLDTYYLTQERRFRGLYDDVAGISDTPQELKVFEMRPDLYTGGKFSYWRVFVSRTILPLYLSMTLGLVGLFVYFHFC